MRLRILVSTAAAMAALLWMFTGVTAPGASLAEEGATAFAADDATVGWTAPAFAQGQGDEQEASARDDERVPVQGWPVLAAGGAAGVGLVLYVLRLLAGWVKPAPPPQEEGH